MSFPVADMDVLMSGLLLLAVSRCRRVALLMGWLLGCTTRRPRLDKVCIAEVTRLVNRCLMCKVLVIVKCLCWVLSAAHAAGQCSGEAIPCTNTCSTACACMVWLVNSAREGYLFEMKALHGP